MLALCAENYLDGLFTSRAVYVDGEIPFAEMGWIAFKYDEWNVNGKAHEAGKRQEPGGKCKSQGMQLGKCRGCRKHAEKCRIVVQECRISFVQCVPKLQRCGWICLTVDRHLIRTPFRRRSGGRKGGVF